MSYCRSLGNNNYKDQKLHEITKFGPFSNKDKNSYSHVAKYIIENRGSVLNREQRKQIPSYLKEPA